MADIDKTCRKYIVEGIAFTALLLIGGLVVSSMAFGGQLFAPLLISAVFTFLIYIAEALIWRRVAKRSPENLPTFFTACSGFRLLLALTTMLVYYLVAGREAMLQFFLVFAVFYVTMLTHHSVFFARVSNRS